MMRPISRSLVGTAALAMGLLAVIGAPAQAAPLVDGTARWTTGGSAARDLTRAGVSLHAGSVAHKRGRHLDVRVTGGTTRVIEHGFGSALVLRKGRRAVRVTELRVRLGEKGRVTGRLDDGAARTLFTLGRAELQRRDGTATSRVLRPRLTRAAARALRDRLRVRPLRGGSFGTLVITVRERPPAAVETPSTVTTVTETTVATVTTPPAATPPALTAGCPAPTAVVGGTPAVSGGTLEWGFKASFRSYIRSGAARGSVSVAGGATESVNGFTFPSPQGVLRADGTGDARYAGAVYFEGHGSGGAALLRLWICRPRVVLTSATAGVLRADIASLTLEGQEIVLYPNVALADLDLANSILTTNGRTRTWTDVPTTLRPDGAGAFAGFYEAGQKLDPVTFHLTAPTT